MSLERLWAGWRGEYVATPPADGPGTLFERILTSGLPDDETFVVHRGDTMAVLLNAYPYGTGHLLVMPIRAVAELDELTTEETVELWATVTDAVRALRRAYSPDGVNVGLNLGKAAGAGIPEHLHVHCLPRWSGDSNFMTAVAETRVMPEALPVTWRKVRDAWNER